MGKEIRRFYEFEANPGSSTKYRLSAILSSVFDIDKELDMLSDAVQTINTIIEVPDREGFQLRVRYLELGGDDRYRFYEVGARLPGCSLECRIGFASGRIPSKIKNQMSEARILRRTIMQAIQDARENLPKIKGSKIIRRESARKK